jgi:hypothetical protein
LCSEFQTLRDSFPDLSNIKIPATLGRRPHTPLVPRLLHPALEYNTPLLAESYAMNFSILLTAPYTKRRPLSLGALLATLLITPAAVLAQPAQAPINLGSAANFVVLAGSLISNVPTSAITGNVGLSPAAGSAITGLSQIEVTGIIYTTDATGPAGSVPDASGLTTAKGDLTTAYNNAAGRTPVPTGSFLNPGTGNIGGLTLVPGLYKFTSSLGITGSNVTLSGSDTSVWIFQVATDLNLGSGIQVILAGGAKARNIFWQVGTSAVLGTTSVMKGTILADQSISLATGAALEGRALARIASVTLASNTITKPAVATSIAGASMASRNALRQINNERSIEFTVAKNGITTLKLYDMNGTELSTLFHGNAVAGSKNTVSLLPENLSRGLYFSKLESGGEVFMSRMLLGR